MARNLEFNLKFRNDASRAFSQVRKDIRSLSKDIRVLNKQSSGTGGKMPLNFKRARQEAAQLNTQLRSVGSAADVLTSKVGKASTKTKALSGSNKELTGRSKRLIDTFQRQGQAMSLLLGPLSGVAARFTSLASVMRSSGVQIAAVSIAVAGLALSLGGLVALADRFTVLSNKVNVAIQGMGDAAAILEQLNEVSRRTRSDLAANVELFQRASLAARELGASQGEIIQFVENVGTALAIQGTSAQQARGALLQLSQAIGSSVVRAEEFNSIMEGALPIVQAAARGIDEAGGSVSRLRQLVLDGTVTNREFFDAILSQTDELEKQFARTTPTLGQGLTVLLNTLTLFAGKFDEVTGLTAFLSRALIALSDAFQFLSDNMAEIAGILTSLGVAFAAGRVRALGFSGALAILSGSFNVLTAAVGRAVAAIDAFALSLLRSPLTLLIAAIGAAAGALVTFTIKASAAKKEAENLRQTIARGSEAMKDFEERSGESVQSALEDNQKLRAAWLTFEEIMEGVGLLASQAASDIGDALGLVVEDVNDFIATIGASFKQLLRLIQAPFKALIIFVQDLVEQIGSVLGKIPRLIEAAFDRDFGLADKIRSEISEGLSSISAGNALDRAVNQSFTGLGEKFLEDKETIKQGLEEIGQGLVSFGVSAGENAVKPIKEGTSQILDRYQKILTQIKLSDQALIEQGKTVEDNSDLVRSINDALEARNNIVGGAIDDLNEEISLQGLSEDKREEERRILEVRNSLLEEGVLLTQEDERLLRDKIQTLQAIEDQNEKNKQKIQEQISEVRKLGQSIQKGLSDAFVNVADNGIDGFADALDNMFDRFKRFLADMAAEAIASPIILSIGQSLGLGRSQQGRDFLSQFGGGAGGGPVSIGDALSLARSGLTNSFFSGSGIAGTIGSSINQFGNTALGVGTRLPGPSLAGGPGGFIEGGLADAFNPASALGGFLGNLGANALFGDRGIGASIGGGIGGLGGTVGGAAAASGLGLAAGSIGAIALPGVGALLGAFAGNALGGLFGNSTPPDNTSASAISLGNSTFRGAGPVFTSETEEASKGLFNAIKAITSTIGGDNIPETVAVRTEVGQRGDNFRSEFTGGSAELDERLRSIGIPLITEDKRSNTFETLDAFLKDLAGNVTTISSEFGLAASKTEDLQIAIENIDFSEPEQALKDLQFAANFENILKDVEPITEAQKAIDAVNNRFDELKETAERLGFTVEDLNRLEEKRAETLRDQRLAFDRGVRQSILGVTDPTVLDIQDITSEFSNLLRNATDFGADISQVNELFKVRILELAEQQGVLSGDQGDTTVSNLEKSIDLAQELSGRFRDAAETLRDSINDIIFNENTSALTLEQRLGIARTQFRETAQRAQQGDIDAIEGLPDVSQQFLELSRQFNASNGQFAKDFELVRKQLEESESFARAQVDVQQGILQSSQKQLDELKNIGAGITGLSDTILKDLVAALQSGGTGGTVGTSLASQLTGGPSFQVSASNPNEIFVQNRAALEASGQISRAEQIIKSFAPVKAGKGRISKFFEQNPTAAAAATAALRSEGVPFFAEGGTTPVNRPFIVGERGPEIMMTRQQHQVFSNGDSSVMLSNAGLAQAIDRLNAKMDAQNTILVDIAESNRVVAVKSDGSQQLEEIARNTERTNSFWRSRNN